MQCKVLVAPFPPLASFSCKTLQSTFLNSVANSLKDFKMQVLFGCVLSNADTNKQRLRKYKLIVLYIEYAVEWS